MYDFRPADGTPKPDLYRDLLAAADALTAEALQDARIDSDHVKAFAESEGESDASARSWKPPGTKFV